ncbi:ribonuclease P protein component [endosymbiont GvMRE of Glomus versiforme]|uniref:ribonuclease P protein component n=1 Tax=endosymbiont GvMRE of Glomus versiforme TaxID=2039283 RepID=UPI003CCC6AD2
MLWKPYRLRKNWMFQAIIKDKSKKRLINSSFLVFATKNSLNNCKFGISIPKKMLKGSFKNKKKSFSVKRNKFKRQIREIIIRYLKLNNNSCWTSVNHIHYNLVIIIRHHYLNSDFSTNQINLNNLFCLIFGNTIGNEKKLYNSV